jgi:uncharacterized protein with von Willebrand factor type A (vWA) domain
MTTGSGDTGRLSENVMHFARVLRGAGIPVGPDRVIDALKALEVTGIAQREDFYWTLASLFVDRREQFELFDQAFHIFWRDPDARAGMAPDAAQRRRARHGGSAHASQPGPGAAPRARAATKEPVDQKQREAEPDAAFTVSERELLQRADFDTMTIAELAQAKKMIAQLRLPIPAVRTRRLTPDPHGRLVDMRASLRASLRAGADVIPLRRRSHARRHPPLVVLCDISGSMKRYSRMFLHFLHAVTNDRDRVHTFVFGTRLTNITRHLRHRDVDLALNGVTQAVADWSGGTRIGASLREFNLRWSRRLLGQNAVVLLITDGLDRELGDDLGAQMDRLHKSSKKVIWLNPLLRFDGFEPRPAGVRAMLPHVDAFLPAHNIASARCRSSLLTAAGNNRRASRT